MPYLKYLTPTILIVVAFTYSFSLASATQTEYCCDAEAELMATKAAEYYKEDKSRALIAFQDKNSSFFYNDLYVFVLNKKGIILAHGERPTLIGKSAYNTKDINGDAFVKTILGVKDQGWVSYRWPDSRDNNKIKEKRSYVIRHKGEAISVGFFVKP